MLLIGCTTYTQTTSGSEYLNRYAEQAQATGAGAMDPEIRAAADVEPILTFPATVGIVRIDGGRLSAIPQAEGEAWLAMARKLGPGWGEFVPISPLIFALAAKPLSKAEREALGCSAYGACIEQMVRDIRLAAARQHTNVVMIYESSSKGERTSNPLAVIWLTLIGFSLAPSESLEPDGIGQVVLLDVRNGYASTTVEDAAATLSTMIDSFKAGQEIADEAKTAAAIELAKEVGEMAPKLRLELAETRAAQASKPR